MAKTSKPKPEPEFEIVTRVGKPGEYVLTRPLRVISEESLVRLLAQVREADWDEIPGKRAADDAARKLAREQYHSDGSIEVDDNAPASRADDNPDHGCYVQAWVWVDDPEEV